MTILDAYAVVAFLRGEPAADEVAPVIRDGSGTLTAVGLAEVIDHLVRIAGAGEDEVAADLADLGLLDVVPVDEHVALDAGRLRARHYHRTRCAVSLADCISAAVARRHDQPLMTSDPHLLELCRAETVATIVLPQSDGTRWLPP